MTQEDTTTGPALNCLNCGAALAGRYCSACGQKDDRHPPTFGHFAAETFESLTHADSRVWQTLWHLLARPGFLTAAYFAGRRARYLPPVRLYIVISVTYFLLLALLHGVSPATVQADPRQAPTSERSASAPPQAANAERPAASAAASTASAPDAVTLRWLLSSDTITLEGGVQACEDLQYRGWGRATLEPRLRQACLRVAGDGGTGFGQALLRQVPRAMFVMLPLFGLVMLAFYWRPRRLYAEHLLFLVHNHSAMFAVLCLELLLSAALPAGWDETVQLAVLGYLLWYTLNGMKVYYGDPWLRNVLKFSGLITLYALMASVLLVFTSLAAALSL